MSALPLAPDRVVPTLTEVLDASSWPVAEPAAVTAAPDPLDEALRRALVAAVDIAVSELREQLLARVETLVRERLAAPTQPLIHRD